LKTIPSLGKSGTSRIIFARSIRSILHLSVLYMSRFLRGHFIRTNPFPATGPKLSIRFLKIHEPL
jgi:hypothetical protein